MISKAFTDKQLIEILRAIFAVLKQADDHAPRLSRIRDRDIAAASDLSVETIDIARAWIVLLYKLPCGSCVRALRAYSETRRGEPVNETIRDLAIGMGWSKSTAHRRVKQGLVELRAAIDRIEADSASDREVISRAVSELMR